MIKSVTNRIDRMNHKVNSRLFHVRFLNVSIDFKIRNESSCSEVSRYRKFIYVVVTLQRFTLILFFRNKIFRCFWLQNLCDIWQSTTKINEKKQKFTKKLMCKCFFWKVLVNRMLKEVYFHLLFLLR